MKGHYAGLIDEAAVAEAAGCVQPMAMVVAIVVMAEMGSMPFLASPASIHAIASRHLKSVTVRDVAAMQGDLCAYFAEYLGGRWFVTRSQFMRSRWKFEVMA